MAYVFANFSFDQRDLDLSRLYYNADGYNFYNNANLIFNGVTYNDVYEVISSVRGQSWASEFGGTGITLDTVGNVIGGTVTGYLEGFWNGSAWVLSWGVQLISVPAADLYNAATTLSTSDDYRIINGALSGNDVFDLSNGPDFAYALGGNDWMFGYGGNDVLFGGNQNDKLFGGNNNDWLFGEKGRDKLFGEYGNDVLKGGKGPDKLNGGTGRDKMFAGMDSHKDEIIFNKTSDSEVGARKRDKVYQFDSREDKIDLSKIDADTGTRGNQVFEFSNKPAANSIWVVDIGKHLVVRGDVNGDTKSDFEIQIMNINSVVESDFVL